MPAPSDSDFEQHRNHLRGLAYRMLGTVSDAEDAVQETYLRWHSADRSSLRETRAWVTTVCTRICLDILKSAQHKRQQYVGEWLPEPLLEETGLSEQQELDETISMALMFTIETLSPAERAAFLLHDVFGYPYDEIANILNLTQTNCRQLASRGRRNLKEGRLGKPAGGRAAIEQLTRAFFDAIRQGNLQDLESMLAKDVVLRADGGGKAPAVKYPIKGSSAVSIFLTRVIRPSDFHDENHLRHVWFNGSAGVVIYMSGKPVSAFFFEVEDNKVANLYVQRNPDKLTMF